MMKICKYPRYDCKDVRDLKDEEDENPSTVCTSAVQNRHRPRMNGMSSQPVLQVVVSNPADRAEKAGQGGKKTGVTCLLTEARRGRSNRQEKLKDLIKSLQEHSPKLGITQVVDTTSVDALPAINTRFGQCPVGSFESYQISVTETNFTFVTTFDGFDLADFCTATEFPPYPPFPLKDCIRSFATRDDLGDKEREFLEC